MVARLSLPFCQRSMAVAIWLSASVACAAENSPSVQAQAAGAYRTPNSWIIPKEVDPESDVVRFLLLAPGGPVLIEASIRVDDKPYHYALEQHLAAMLKKADRDRDEKVTWEEGLASFIVAGRALRTLPRQSKSAADAAAAFDLDRDGIVSRHELRRLVALSSGGPPLVIGSSFGYPANSEASFQQAIDQDRDGIFAAAEMDSLPRRLLLLDANDNEIVDSYEILGAKTAAYHLPAASQRAFLFQVAPDSDWNELQRQLLSRYKPGRGSLGTGEPRLAEMVAALDKNQDDALDVDELPRLVDLEPQVRVAVNLGERNAQPAGAFITSISNALRKSAGLSETADEQRTTKLEIPGIRLAVTGLSDNTQYSNAAESQARSYMARFDKDKNGYLDKKELKDQPGLAQVADAWDSDGDGMIYLEEIRDTIALSSRLSRSRVTLGLMDEPKELFKLVDANHDSRLGRREMEGAKAQLLALDASGNGQLEPEEYPGVLRITFSLGRNPFGTVRMLRGRSAGTNRVAARPAQKDWFFHMDVNGDDEISAREFLGSLERFQAMDRNHDGLLTRTEADATALP